MEVEIVDMEKCDRGTSADTLDGDFKHTGGGFEDLKFSPGS